MKRTWTIIGVRDVPRIFKRYQSMFGQTATAPAHSYFGQLVDSDGTVLLCLHEWAVESHPPLLSPEDGTPGNGLLLFFRVDDYANTLQRAKALGLPDTIDRSLRTSAVCLAGPCESATSARYRNSA